jgi:hypothetical protein
MAYQSHHCSATLLCSACISAFLHASLALFVLLSDMHFCSLLLLRFMLYFFFPFYAPRLFCVLQLLHTTCFYSHESHSTAPPISSLFYIFIFSVHQLHPLNHTSACSSHYYIANSQSTHTALFCISLSRRVLCLIIIQLIIFFGGYTKSVRHQWLVLRFSAFSGSATHRLLGHI